MRVDITMYCFGKQSPANQNKLTSDITPQLWYWEPTLVLHLGPTTISIVGIDSIVELRHEHLKERMWQIYTPLVFTHFILSKVDIATYIEKKR